MKLTVRIALLGLLACLAVASPKEAITSGQSNVPVSAITWGDHSVEVAALTWGSYA